MIKNRIPPIKYVAIFKVNKSNHISHNSFLLINLQQGGGEEYITLIKYFLSRLVHSKQLYNDLEKKDFVKYPKNCI